MNLLRITEIEWLAIKEQLATIAAKAAVESKPSLPQNCALPQMDEDKESA